jgi:hypothetical protein
MDKKGLIEYRSWTPCLWPGFGWVGGGGGYIAVERDEDVSVE